MSTSSADPAALQTYVTRAEQALRDLDAKVAHVRNLGAAFRSGGLQLDDGGTTAALNAYLTDAQALDRSVAVVRQAFLDADNGPGTRTVSDAVIAAHLRAAGVSIPTGPPVSVEDPQILGQPVDSGVADDPVNTANGNFVEVETDLAQPARAVAAAWIRTYSSRRSRVAGALGRGWACWADSRLEPVLDSFAWHLPDGAVRLVSAGDLPDGSGTVTVTPDAVVVVLPRTRERWEFDASGRPVRVVSGATEAALSWADGRLQRVTHVRSGRWVAPTWDGERIVAVTSSDGRTVAYEYDRDGDLVLVRRVQGDRRYVVEHGLVTSVTDADGVVEVSNTYDDEGRVTSQVSADGRVSRYAYRPGLHTVVSGADGSGLNAYSHDEAGRLVAVTDDRGESLRRVFDASGRLVHVTDRGGAETGYDYDDRGDLVRVVDALGAELHLVWDDQHRPTAVTDRTGRTTRFGYVDACRTPSTVSDAAGTTTIEVDPRDDLPVRVTDPDGVSFDLTWDDDGQLTSLRSAAGEIRWDYDDVGNLVAVDGGLDAPSRFDLDDAGHVLVARNGRGEATRFGYTPAGRTSWVMDPLGNRTTARYAASGRLVELVDALGSSLGIGYDDEGNTISFTAPDGRRFGFGYDGNGRLVSATDAVGAQTQRGYDADGLLVSLTTPAGRSTHARYDAAERLVEVEAAELDAEVQRDAEGRVVAVVAPDGSVTRYGYDAAGRLVEVVAPGGARTAFGWTPGGRLASVVDPRGLRTELTHDAAGRLATVLRPDGTLERLTHDAAGQVVRHEVSGGATAVYSFDAAGDLVAYDDGTLTARVERDARGYPVEVTDGTATTRCSYDARGALTELGATGLGSTRYRYDECGRLVEVVDALGGTTRYGYDAAGRPATVTDPLGRSRALERDPDGLVTAERLADGSGRRWWYDAAGRVTAVGAAAGERPVDAWTLDRNGRVVRATGDTGSAELEWDADGRLVAMTTGSGTLVWERDAAGAVVARTAVRDLTSVPVGEGRPVRPVAEPELDAAGQLVAFTGPTGRVRLTWDEGGRLLAEEHEHEGRRSFGYDAAGQLLWSEDRGGTTTYGYDPAGRRVEERRPDGTVVRFGWDDRGRLASVSRTAAAATATTELRYDPLGLLTSVGGVPVLCDPTQLGSPVVLLGGERVDPVGDGALLVTADGARPLPAEVDPWFQGAGDGVVVIGERVLDPRTRSFLSVDPLSPVPGRPGGANPYAYCFNDPTRWRDPVGLRPLTEDELKGYRQSQERGAFGNAWEAMKHDPWGTVAMVGVIAVGVGLEFVPGGQVIGTGILIGAATSAGFGLATGHFDPRQVALGGAIGGAAAGLGPLAGALGAGAGRVAVAGAGAVIGGGFGVASYVTTSLLKGDPITGRGLLGAGAGGALAGGIGALAGPTGGTVARTVMGQSARSGAASVTTAIINTGAGAAGTVTNDLVAGRPVTRTDVLVGAGGGLVGGALGDRFAQATGAEGTGMTTLRQMDHFAPQSVGAALNPFHGPNSASVVSTNAAGAGVGIATDLGHTAVDVHDAHHQHGKGP